MHSLEKLIYCLLEGKQWLLAVGFTWDYNVHLIMGINDLLVSWGGCMETWKII